jgi:DMSO/TMAO reductase YedYZ molybdopterin-dependent catalytic subunit
MKHLLPRLLILASMLVIVAFYALNLSFFFSIGGGGAGQVPPTMAEEPTDGPRSSLSGAGERTLASPPPVDIDTYRLKISGQVTTAQAFSYDEVLTRFPRHSRVATLSRADGGNITARWEGVRLTDLLDEAGVAPEADTVIVSAPDGYAVSLPLAYLYDRDIILAYAANGATLSPEAGFPFLLVAEGRGGSTWVRWVTAIEVAGDQPFEVDASDAGGRNDSAEEP